MSYFTNAQYGAKTASRNASLLETLQPAGLIDLFDQHFVEYFSGGTLDSIWTQTNTGSASQAMSDTKNGGYALTTGTTDESVARIDFNGIQHYNFPACKMIAVKRDNESTEIFNQAGLVKAFTANRHFIKSIAFPAISSFYYLATSDSTPGTNVDTTIPIDTITHKHELEISSASARYSIDGQLEVITTSTLPAEGLEPVITCRNRTISPRTCNLLYCEVYNT